MTSQGFSDFVTPMVERFVYGLVYPAILGASIVEVFGKADLRYAVPWLFIALIFILDYSVTAPESSEKPPKGNAGLALVDLFAAAIFFLVYLRIVDWDGASALTNTEVRLLVLVLLLLQFAYVVWYAVRWSTIDSAEVVDRDSYKNLVGRNMKVALIQAAIVVLLVILSFFVVPHVHFT